MRIKSAIVAANMLCCCCCSSILGYCLVREWTRIYYVIGLKNIRISPLVHSLSDSLRIYFFHSGERILKCPESLSNSPDACGRKPNPRVPNWEQKSGGFKIIRITLDGALRWGYTWRLFWRRLTLPFCQYLGHVSSDANSLCSSH